MIAAPSRPRQPEPAQDTGPSPEYLRIPSSVLAAAGPSELVGAVLQSQESRVGVTALFDSAFEDLVTAGRADDYPALVDRFKLNYAAISENFSVAPRLPLPYSPCLPYTQHAKPRGKFAEFAMLAMISVGPGQAAGRQRVQTLGQSGAWGTLHQAPNRPYWRGGGGPRAT